MNGRVEGASDVRRSHPQSWCRCSSCGGRKDLWTHHRCCKCCTARPLTVSPGLSSYRRFAADDMMGGLSWVCSGVTRLGMRGLRGKILVVCVMLFGGGILSGGREEELSGPVSLGCIGGYTIATRPALCIFNIVLRCCMFPLTSVILKKKRASI